MSDNGKVRKGTPEGNYFENDLKMVEEDLEERDVENEFVQSIRKFWDDRGYVTEKQSEAIDKFVVNIDRDFSGFPG